ncbi:MAG: type II toxin-antitoxin system Phd/YefM family antitoxin [Candidatus Magasanikbacteria bacterium]|jgi:prevent-host-death family protein|nr:type II toxin-antitoxin system Phd/YefM family antitoxin [Candidatus Magasanikbacteria bacterium]MBT4071842.1 type II toxin-antitoxin system Phd/YefM family antitoxin [Candidatus Magasanikbacteria bacterium]
MTIETTSITDARKRIFDLAEQVCEEKTHVILTERGKPKVVLISATEFESLQQTVQALEKDHKLPEKKKKAITHIRAKSYMDLESALTKQGFIVADKTKQQYDPY